MKYYYLLASLPSLKLKFTTPPPLTVAAFWSKIQQESESLKELIYTILLEKELSILEQIYNDKSPTQSITIPVEALTRFPKDSTLHTRYLPESFAALLKGEKWQPNIWLEYYRYALEIAERSGSVFSEWLHWEMALKQTFFEERKQKNPTELWNKNPIEGERNNEHARLLESYYKASNPLQAEQLLDKARWDKLSSLSIPYSFGQDEVVVYALQLLLLERWWIISQNQQDIIQKVANG